MRTVSDRNAVRENTLHGVEHVDLAVEAPGQPQLGALDVEVDRAFGNVVRDALRLGFTLVPYEGSAKPETRAIGPREEFHARALAAALREAPGGRLFVHCGFAHSFKRAIGPGDDERWMACRLWEKTGVEPFTVWQLSSGPTFSAPSRL